MTSDILVVDDEPDIRDLVAGVLEDEGYSVRTAATAETALEQVRSRAPRLVVLDVWLQGSDMDGLSLLRYLKSIDPIMPVIMISGHGNIETAIAAIRRGAYDFIEKPFKADRLIHLVERALESAALKRENDELRTRSGPEAVWIGDSAPACALRSAIDKVAPTNSRVMITGRAGCGKELVARLIHDRSHRKDGPFVVVNAASVAPEQMELALFGAEDPGGRPVRIGYFEQAHAGTLLIDEVADMPLGTQSKILRVLTDQSFHRVGGRASVRVDVRVMSSTTRNLAEEIAEGRFREDLFYRLNVVPMDVPALSERRDDIPALVVHFTQRISQSSGLAAPQFASQALAVLQSMDWPGNVRQLRNLVERIMILNAGHENRTIGVDDLPRETGSARDGQGGVDSADLVGLSLRAAREQFEREYLSLQITRFNGNISRTAEFIGMERSALHRKLKALGVSSGQMRQDS